ncbi:MAG: STAS/SEC14 domain-containing protein [Luteimonas sp.]
MPLKLREDGKLLEAQLSGKLVKEDYSELVLAAERLLKAHGKIRIMLDMHDFHGWTAGAAWEDIKFDARHFNDIERLAVVGETQWQHAMAELSKPFTGAKVHWFDRAERSQADAWLQIV